METETNTILVVDDDATVAEVVTRYLEREGFAVVTVGSGEEAMRRVEGHPPDLAVLDLMLPGMDGLELFGRLRAVNDCPVIMLTARGSESERLLGLARGADDYVSKPFSPRELTARVKAVLRRVGGDSATVAGTSPPLVLGDLVVDLRAREVLCRERPVSLTAKEFDLLAYFLRNPQRSLSREELLEHVWGWTYGDTSTVTVHVRRLREKIEEDPAHPERLCTVWGAGYRFDTEGDERMRERSERTMGTGFPPQAELTPTPPKAVPS